ncbi:Protein of unknown function [Bacillus mobilis]|nr:Protein of unknown function [Bacillus mobilis]
MELEDIMEKH